MRKISFLIAMAGSLLCATSALGQVPCNQCGQFSTPADIRNCMATCVKATTPPTPDAGPKHTSPTPDAGPRHTTVDAAVPPPPPPPVVDAGLACYLHEVHLTANTCVCVTGYGRLTDDGHCVAVCKDGEVRDSAGKCALPPPCEQKPAPPPPTGGDWWWILLILLLASLGGNGWQYANRNKKEGPKGA